MRAKPTVPRRLLKPLPDSLTTLAVDGLLLEVGRVAARLRDEARDDAVEDRAGVEALLHVASRNASTVSGARPRSSSITKLPTVVYDAHACGGGRRPPELAPSVGSGSQA